MARHDVVIIKDTHRGLLYEDGVLKDVLPAGRHLIPRPGSSWISWVGLGRREPGAEVVLVDVRKADRTVVVPDVLTADGVTISASFAVQFRVSDPRAAIHEVRNPGERLQGEVQAAARRLLRGATLDEVLAARDELADEVLSQVGDSAAGYGIEVSDVDLKELALPDEFRDSLNRAAFAKYIHLARPIEVWDEEASARDTDEDEFGQIAASTRVDDPALILSLTHEVDDPRYPLPEESVPNPRRYRAAAE